MLNSLYIRNFILINELNIEFRDGLSVFTGETGAGKSIFIGHGCGAGKLYGLQQRGTWYRPGAIDYAIASSKDMIPFVAQWCGLPESKVIPLGMPRTDAYFSAKKPEHDGKRHLNRGQEVREAEGLLLSMRSAFAHAPIAGRFCVRCVLPVRGRREAVRFRVFSGHIRGHFAFIP